MTARFFTLPSFGLDQFWSKVDVRGSDDCWPWTGSVNEHGYGGVMLGGRRGRLWKAHRVAYLLAHPGEELSTREFVCHHCDNPPCVNPAHLFKGDYATNAADKVAKGRQSRGIERSIALTGRMQSGSNHWTHRHPERMNLSGLNGKPQPKGVVLEVGSE